MLSKNCHFFQRQNNKRMDLEKNSAKCSKNETEAKKFAASLDYTSDINIYTDGACSGNPGPGGWGVVIQGTSSGNSVEMEYGGGSQNTTNNRMELIATIEAINIFNPYQKVKLHTDSKYVFEGITKWVKGWRKFNYRRNQGKDELLNSDLWRRLDELNNNHSVEWIWVKGHSTNAGNNRADRIAVSFTPVNGTQHPGEERLKAYKSAAATRNEEKQMTLNDILDQIINNQNPTEYIEKLRKYNQKYSLSSMLKSFHQTI